MRDLPSVPVHDSPALVQGSPLVKVNSAGPSISSTGQRNSATASFLSIVSNMVRTTTSPTPERTKPVVSAPMSLPGTTDRRSIAQNVGTSWASLIDPSALENIPDKERKRQESIFEFVATEQTYVQSLQLIIEVSKSIVEVE